MLMIHWGLFFSLSILPVESSTTACASAVTSSDTPSLNCCSCRIIWPTSDVDDAFLKLLIAELDSKKGGRK